MKTLVLLFCHCGVPMPPPPFRGCAFNHPVVITNLIWAVTAVLLGVFALCYLNKRVKMKKMMTDADRQHELDLKEKTNEIEEKWFDKNKQAKEEELTRKIREFEELTIRQKLLDKVIEARKDKEIGDMKATLAELKKKYEILDGEIEKIIIKKKQ